MNEHILTIIDMKGELRELNLDHFHKSQITLGRDASRCDIVIPDPIVSKIHGTFSMEGGQIRYQDQDSRNGTFLGIGSGRRLLAKNDGFVEVYDKSILCIGNMNQAENMVLLLYSSSSERELWKRETLERPTTTIGRDTANHIWSIQAALQDLSAAGRVCAGGRAQYQWCAAERQLSDERGQTER